MMKTLKPTVYRTAFQGSPRSKRSPRTSATVQIAATSTAVTMSMRTGGVFPDSCTVRGTRLTTATDSAAASASFRSRGGVNAFSMVDGCDTPSQSNRRAGRLGTRSGSRPGGGEPPLGLEQMLRQHLDVREHRHEVRVAGPAR